jgi:hypothetical protein
VLAIESDSGVFAPEGFSLEGSEAARAAAREIATLLRGIGSDRIEGTDSGADIGPLVAAGVPGMGLRVDSTHYFDIHHTNADTMDKVDPQAVARCVATVAVMAYVAADMPRRLGR